MREALLEDAVRLTEKLREWPTRVEEKTATNSNSGEKVVVVVAVSVVPAVSAVFTVFYVVARINS